MTLGKKRTSKIIMWPACMCVQPFMKAHYMNETGVGVRVPNFLADIISL
jgi:hypothetical protein